MNILGRFREGCEITLAAYKAGTKRWRSDDCYWCKYFSCRIIDGYSCFIVYNEITCSNHKTSPTRLLLTKPQLTKPQSIKPRIKFYEQLLMSIEGLDCLTLKQARELVKEADINNDPNK